MISAREFCREPGYPITIFFSYSFDPLFFERIPLGDLEKGGSRRIVVVADATQLNDAIQRCVGQVVYLGRRYVLAEAASSHTFHPKLIARLSETAGQIWVGSGNLTYRGWGGNHELATQWRIGPSASDKGRWLNELLEAAGGLIRSSSFGAELAAIRESVPWLVAPSTKRIRPPALLGLPSRPLTQQLAERWKGRRFNELKLCTGSTDEGGAFLLWAHRMFGIKRATICLTPAFASFVPSLLKKLPIDIRIVKADPDQLMHAKFYWFSGPDGDAAVVGSANCSAAAWLAGGGYGNIELVVPYDDVREDDFKHILKIFKGRAYSPEKITFAKSIDVDRKKAEELQRYHLVSARLRSVGRIIEAIVEPHIPEGGETELVVSGLSGSVRIKMDLRSGELRGRVPPQFELAVGTLFATAEIVLGNHRVVTSPRWIDNEAALRRASSETLFDPRLRDLSRERFMSSDQQQMTETVRSVAAQLLSGISKPLRKRQGDTVSKQDGNENVAADNVDPETIIRSLQELTTERRLKGIDRNLSFGGSLAGVIGLLFSRSDDDEEIDLSQEAWTGDNPDAANSEEKKSNLKPDAPPRQLDGETTGIDVSVRLQKEIDKFLWELGRPSFSESCDVARMVQALAFPLLVCARGNEAGLLPSTVLTSVAERVVHIMLNHGPGAEGARGLLRQVHDRYANLGRQDEFLAVTGQGTLWAALLAALMGAEDQSLKSSIQLAGAVSQVFACAELLSVASVDGLSALMQNLIIKNSEFFVTTKAPLVVTKLATLTTMLSENWNAIFQEQGSGRRLQSAGSVLWSPKWGWKFLPASPAGSYHAEHVNLEKAALQWPPVQNAIDNLRAAVALKA